MPRLRPPYPADRGLNGRPTVVNNVKTFASVQRILDGGWEAFARPGSGTTRGTTVFALAGKVLNTGLVEVPMGTPLRRLLVEIGGHYSNVIRFLPPLVLTEELAKKGIEIFADSIREVEKTL